MAETAVAEYKMCNEKKANALIVAPNDKGGCFFTVIDDEKIPSDAREISIEWTGRWVYFLELKDGALKPAENNDLLQQLPSVLREAIAMPANRKLWSMSHHALEKIAMWAPVAVIGIGCILLFAMANKGGAA